MAPLAQGGMGTTYLACRRGRSEPEFAVIKRPYPEVLRDPQGGQRFSHESFVGLQLRHPHIVRTLAVGEDEHGPFLLLEYIHGTTLQDLMDWTSLRAQDFPLAAALGVLAMGLSALEALHHARDANGGRLDLVHRDVSPANILLSTWGAVKLCDFGVAKSTLSTFATAKNYVLGRLAFLPPEYLRDRVSDPRWDVYSLGISVWTALAGRLPFSQRSAAEAYLKASRSTPPSLSEIRSDVSQDLDGLLQSMCAPRLADRPSSQEALERLLARTPGNAGREGQASLALLISQQQGLDLQARSHEFFTLATELCREM